MGAVAEPTSSGAPYADRSQARRPPRPRHPRHSLDCLGRQPAVCKNFQAHTSRVAEGSPRERLGFSYRSLDQRGLRDRPERPMRPCASSGEQG